MSRNKFLMPPACIYAFFILGLMATLSIRMIIVVKHIDPELVRVAWYVGILGNVMFFAYRYHITMKRKRLIIQHNLISKVDALKDIPEEDKELLGFIVSSVVKSREHFNYLFIFASSIVAITIDLVWESLA